MRASVLAGFGRSLKTDRAGQSTLVVTGRARFNAPRLDENLESCQRVPLFYGEGDAAVRLSLMGLQMRGRFAVDQPTITGRFRLAPDSIQPIICL